MVRGRAGLNVRALVVEREALPIVQAEADPTAPTAWPSGFLHATVALGTVRSYGDAGF